MVVCVGGKVVAHVPRDKVGDARGAEYIRCNEKRQRAGRNQRVEGGTEPDQCRELCIAVTAKIPA